MLLAGISGVSAPVLPSDREMVWYTFTVQFDAYQPFIDDVAAVRGIVDPEQHRLCREMQRLDIAFDDIELDFG